MYFFWLINYEIIITYKYNILYKLDIFNQSFLYCIHDFVFVAGPEIKCKRWFWVNCYFRKKNRKWGSFISYAAPETNAYVPLVF